jgi:hypothetical protein
MSKKIVNDEIKEDERGSSVANEEDKEDVDRKFNEPSAKRPKRKKETDSDNDDDDDDGSVNDPEKEEKGPVTKRKKKKTDESDSDQFDDDIHCNLRRPPLLTEQEAESLNGAVIFDPSDLDAAIIATYLSPAGAVAVYDYDLLVEINVQMMKDGEEDVGDDEYELFVRACEDIDFNTVRSVPYSGPRGPIIVREEDNMGDEDLEEYDFLEISGHQRCYVIQAGQHRIAKE